MCFTSFIIKMKSIFQVIKFSYLGASVLKYTWEMAFFSKLKAHLFFYDIKKILQNGTSNDLNYTFFLNDYFDGKKKMKKKKHLCDNTR